MTLAVVGCLAAGMGGCADSPADAALGFVRRLGGRAETVRRIDLAHTATTDADLARLAKLGGEALAGVEDLDLTHTAITDSGLTTLAAFSTLRKLSLTLTAVTDAGLPAILPLGTLSELYLIETAVTDAGVEPLSRLSSLRRLVLLRTAVSAVGLERLRRALPGATIDVEPPVVRARRAAR
ncbi:MAG: hypothetical protein WCO90_11665 [Planctomycetota bacterium]|jgi:hypothetical protein